MNEKEQLVLRLIQENPYLSQQEMAERLGMSRPALANTVSSLIRKGEVIGRAYVLPRRQAIVTIGGANVDRKFHVEGAVQLATSNPTNVTTSVGGVARNIAENLGRLGNDVKLMTVLGEDADAEKIKQHSEEFMSFEMTATLQEHSTGSYSAVLSRDGELVIAMADMAIYDELLPGLMSKHESRILDAKCIVVDLNCPQEAVEYVLSLAKLRKIPFVIVPVSSPKMSRMPENLIGVTYFICNRDEAETYLSRPLQTEEDYELAVRDLLDKGAEHVVLTLGGAGVVVGSKDRIERLYAISIETIIDVTGAGDAFVSAFLHAALHGELFIDAVRFGLYNASKTLQCDTTVREDLSSNELTIWRES
ncbi:carbohydrate kinase [Lysinibacillus sp. LZ02]|uniref:carbohydrate kinase n=1 Tax=Lysinibacillus sp. LZ02 TaxID=3420668 RepID=UPI003D3686E5